MTAVLGVDPGAKGGLVVLVDDILVAYTRMPAANKKVSPVLVAAWLRDLPDLPDVAVIERVGVRPGEANRAGFTFGRGVGAVEGALGYAQVPTHYVTPTTWKGNLGLPGGTDKGPSLARALELWPSLASTWRVKANDGIAEAALIAHWHLHHGRHAGGSTPTQETSTP